MKKTIIIIFLIAVIQPMTAICLCSPIVTDHGCCGDTIQHETKTKVTDNMTKGEKSVKPNETPRTPKAIRVKSEMAAITKPIAKNGQTSRVAIMLITIA